MPYAYDRVRTSDNDRSSVAFSAMMSTSTSSSSSFHDTCRCLRPRFLHSRCNKHADASPISLTPMYDMSSDTTCDLYTVGHLRNEFSCSLFSVSTVLEEFEEPQCWGVCISLAKKEPRWSVEWDISLGCGVCVSVVTGLLEGSTECVTSLRCGISGFTILLDSEVSHFSCCLHLHNDVFVLNPLCSWFREDPHNPLMLHPLL